MWILYHLTCEVSVLVVEAKALSTQEGAGRGDSPLADAQSSRWQYLHLLTAPVPNFGPLMSEHCDEDSQLRGSFILDPISILRESRTQTGDHSVQLVGYLQIYRATQGDGI